MKNNINTKSGFSLLGVIISIVILAGLSMGAYKQLSSTVISPETEGSPIEDATQEIVDGLNDQMMKDEQDMMDGLNSVLDGN